MNLKRFGVFVLMVMALLIICKDAKTIAVTNKSSLGNEPLYAQGTMPKDRVEEILAVALEAVMDDDPALNQAMRYIAIDITRVGELSPREKAALKRHFEKYGVRVMAATLEDLKAQGMFDKETISIEGILLKVDKVLEIGNRKAVLRVSKYKSGLGAIGMEVVLEYQIIPKYNEGRWVLIQENMKWIS